MTALDGEGVVELEGDLVLVESCCLTLGIVEGCYWGLVDMLHTVGLLYVVCHHC